MYSPVSHTRRPQDFGPFALAGDVAHSVHRPYYFFDSRFIKINVIDSPYDLWRRTT
jgi:hypothetical protein